jgi:hypothetical protein
VDELVVKTRNHDEFISDLEETFNSLRKFRCKLNTTKCVFGVPQGKLLRFIVSHQGIEANSEKIAAITNRRSRTSRSSQGAWQLLTYSSLDLGKEDYLSSSS